MKANAVGHIFTTIKSNREICVICGSCKEPMFRDCHAQAICSKECHEEYLDMCESDKNGLH